MLSKLWYMVYCFLSNVCTTKPSSKYAKNVQAFFEIKNPIAINAIAFLEIKKSYCNKNAIAFFEIKKVLLQHKCNCYTETL